MRRDWSWKDWRAGRGFDVAHTCEAFAPVAYNAWMFARALIVLLLVLNAGVATWWAMRKPALSPAAEQPHGVARLQLLAEVPTHAAAQSPASHPAAVPSASQCFTFGPFADAAAVATARMHLQPLAISVAPREQIATPARGWRVQLRPQATPEAAQAMAQRIAAAGFNDLLVVREGPEANAIALGRYRGEEPARRRAAALVAAGFDARAEPLGEARTATWLDVAAGPGFDAAVAQVAAAAPQQRTIDCAAAVGTARPR